MNLNGTQDQKQRYLPEADQRRACRRAGDERAGRRAPTWSRMKLQGGEEGRSLRPERHRRCGSPTGPTADVIVVYAKTDPGEEPARASPPSWSTPRLKGFSVAQKLDKLGMRGSDTGELVFDNVRSARGERARRRSTAGCAC
ncbi:MAG: hypothetical protein ACMVO3_11240 [Thalassobaculum sp.]